MKRYLLFLLLTLLVPLTVSAQSNMSDDQVMKFILKEHKSGTSQSQIVTKLMQKGVDISQIRRVRKKAERLQKEDGLGAVSMGTKEDGKSDDRTRSKNDGKNRKKNNNTEDENVSDYRLEDGRKTNKKRTRTT